MVEMSKDDYCFIFSRLHAVSLFPPTHKASIYKHFTWYLVFILSLDLVCLLNILRVSNHFCFLNTIWTCSDTLTSLIPFDSITQVHLPSLHICEFQINSGLLMICVIETYTCHLQRSSFKSSHIESTAEPTTGAFSRLLGGSSIHLAEKHSYFTSHVSKQTSSWGTKWPLYTLCGLIFFLGLLFREK